MSHAAVYAAPQGAGMNQAIGALVRRHDPDRFLTALFAPP
jgi:hypothetical protein